MKKLFALLAFALLLSAPLFGQGGVNSIVATYTSAAMTLDDSIVKVNSATGISVSPATILYVVDVGNPRGEAMKVTAVSSTTITVSRGQSGTSITPHASGAMVLLGRPDWFYTRDPLGKCTAASTHANPWVNIASGNQWLCSTITGTWVAGFGNHSVAPKDTTAVASAAGAVTPTGPLFHMTGTEAITSFTVAVGMRGNDFCVIPDAAFTTVAGNNIAEASTADANQTLCFTWDATNSKYTSSY